MEILRLETIAITLTSVLREDDFDCCLLVIFIFKSLAEAVVLHREQYNYILTACKRTVCSARQNNTRNLEPSFLIRD